MWPGAWRWNCPSRYLSPLETATGDFTGTACSTLNSSFPERGWWYLMDLQETGGGGMLTRDSFNYTFAAYDADTGTLYYQELDT